MLNEKFFEVLSHPADGIVAIATTGEDGAHVVNTWNSYINVTTDQRFLIPASRMHKTEQNLKANNRVELTIGNREVQGTRYKGTGFLIQGTAKLLHEGPDFDLMKGKFEWLRAVLEISIETVEHTL